MDSIMKQNIPDLSSYGFDHYEKSKFLLRELNALTEHHRRNCKHYSNFLNNFKKQGSFQRVEDIPFFSVRAFKEFDLLSIDKENIFKTMTSSGTSGQAVSKIYLDQETALLQSKILSKLMRDVTGSKRIPMLIIDCPSSVKSRTNFSARGAGIIGFSMYGKETTYALNDDYELDLKNVSAFFKRNKNKRIFVFGFTFMVWKYFLNDESLLKLNISVPDGVLLHGGGWKKLSEEAVSSDDFKNQVKRTIGIRKTINYYGLVEQTGSLFFECEAGFYTFNLFRCYCA